MNQSKLEEKVKEIFERQKFEIKQMNNDWKAVKESETLELGIYSSKKYGVETVMESVSEGQKIFVDEGLEELKDKIDNQVSVLRMDEEVDQFELPSYELIGEIAVINELTVDEDEAVEGILHHHPSVKTILLKQEPLQGEYRVGEYKKLHGGETETVHKEFGCRFKVDPTAAFFSEREGTERKRVLESVEDGEKILVMFSGVAPYPVLLAEKKDVEVVGIEKNPEAVKYARENIEINGVEESVEIIEEDVRNIEDNFPRFDRILMPSPTNAEKFLNKAFELASKKTIITLYTISDNENPFRKTKKEIKQFCRDKKFNVEFLDERIVSDYSPSKVKIAIEFKIS